jgi:hypothetical protein
LARAAGLRWPEVRIRSGEQVVQPVKGGGPEDDGCHAFAVSFCAVTMQVTPRPHRWQDLFSGIPKYFYNVD